MRIAVASSVLGTSGVVRLCGLATILEHFGEVDGTVKTARKVRDVDIHGELLPVGVEHVIAGGAVHKVGTRSNVGVRASGHKVKAESAAGSGDSVGTRVVSAIDSAVLRASGGVGAEGCVPLVATVTVGVPAGKSQFRWFVDMIDDAS